jgi:hypothetical protein
MIVSLDVIVSDEASEEMVACDILLIIEGESNGRERLDIKSDLDRPYMSIQSSVVPISNDPVLHTDPGVSPSSGISL